MDSVNDSLLASYGPGQYGFRPRSSTTCALIALHHHVSEFLDRSDVMGVQMVSYDLSKAFDRLNSDLIVNRLSACNLPQNFVLWVKDYLSQRRQYVKIGDICSNISCVTSGVPQGSILGPYLFSVVLGEFLSSKRDSLLIKFADDCTFSFPLYENCENRHVTEEHHRFLNWCKAMSLPVNMSKCKSLTFRKRKPCNPVMLEGVHVVNSLKLLGVTFEMCFSWSKHVDNVILTASRRLRGLCILRKFLSRKQLRSVYFATVRSVLEYCNPLFLNLTKKNSSRIARLQARFHRLLCGQGCADNCLESLDDRRRIQALKLFDAAQRPDHVLHDLLPRRSSRSGRFLLPRMATVRRKNTFMHLCVLYFNKLKRR